METGIWSSYFIDLSPEEMVKAFSRKGWYKLELSDEHAASLLARGNPAETGKKFKSFALNYGISFPQGHLWLECDIAAINRSAVIKKLKQWLDLFLAVGIRSAVLHPGGQEMMKTGCNPESIMKARVSALNELSKHINGNDMVLCLENIASTAPECDDLLKIIEAACSPNLAICLDTGHLNLGSGKQAEFIKKAGQYLQALHIADNDGVSDQHLMPFARGTVPWNEVITALKEINYTELFNFEIPGESKCPLPVRLAKLDYLKEIASLMVD